MSETKYNKEYFDQMLDESTQEELYKHRGKTEKLMSKLPKNTLIELFKKEGKDFYLYMLTCIGTLRIINRSNANIQKGIDEIKQAMGLNDEEAIAFLKEQGIIDGKINGQSTIKLICGKLLGFLKLMWDTTLVCLGLTSRVSVKLVCNVVGAIIDTGKYAVNEGKEAGKAIKKSWDVNMRGKEI